MPELKCTVQTCTHNKNFYCDLEGIVVGGSNAKNCEETCCDSFEERKDSYSNSMGSSMNSMNSSDITDQASALSNIDCKAVDCKYNDNCACHAGKISVEGSNACQCEQTECATFTCTCR